MTNQVKKTPTSSSLSMLVLEAFEYVRKDRIEDYERMGRLIDDKVKETEPGILFKSTYPIHMYYRI